MALEAVVPVQASRYVLIHYHIFKNAGSTVEFILERGFPGQFATLHGRIADAVLDARDLVGFLQRHPGMTAISSHHLRYPKPVSRRTVFFDCCFLRHPLARLSSLYHHFRRSAESHPYADWAKSYSPREFVMHLLNEAPHQVNDVQVTLLANGGTFTRPADEQDLERATGVLRDMAFPGLVELFDESLVVAEYFLRPAFPKLWLEYVPQNVSHAARKPPAESREYWEDLWGKDLCERLLRGNAMDLELVHRAKLEILRRLDRIPRVAERLANLQLRCARLASASCRVEPEPIPPRVPSPEEPAPRRIAARHLQA